jgi:hypothetical protein
LDVLPGELRAVTAGQGAVGSAECVSACVVGAGAGGALGVCASCRGFETHRDPMGRGNLYCACDGTDLWRQTIVNQ